MSSNRLSRQKALLTLLTAGIAISQYPEIVGYALSVAISTSFVFSILCFSASVLLKFSASTKPQMWAILNDNYRSDSMVLKAISFYILWWKNLLDKAFALWGLSSTKTVEEHVDNERMINNIIYQGENPSLRATSGKPTTICSLDNEITFPNSQAAIRTNGLRRPRRIRRDDDEVSIISQSSMDVRKIRGPNHSNFNSAFSDERVAGHDLIVSDLQNKLQTMKDQSEKNEEDLNRTTEKLALAERELDDRRVVLAKMEDDLKRTTSNRDEIEHTLEKERAKIEKLMEAQKKTSELLEGSQVIAINETRNLTAALAVERQKVSSLETENKEISENAEKIKQQLSQLEDEKLASSGNFDMKKLLQNEKNKTELLTQAHAQMDKLMEDGMQIGDIFAGRKFSNDPVKAAEEKLVLMENHMQTFTKSSAGIRLRLIKNQKLLMLEKDKATAVEEELDKMNDQIKHEKMKLRESEQKLVQAQDRLASQKAEKEKFLQRETAANLYLEAEKGKTQDLLRLMEEKDRKAKKEKEQDQTKIEALETKAEHFSTQIDIFERKLTEKDASNEELIKKRDEFELKAIETTKELEKVNAETKEKDEKIAELQRTVDSLESKLSVALNEIKQSNENIRSVSKSRNLLESEVEDLKTRNREIESECAGLKESISSLENNLEKKNVTLLESQKRVSELDNFLQEAQQENKERGAKETEILNDQAKLIDLLESVKSKLVEKEGALKELKLAKTGMEDSLAAKNEKVNCLQKRVEELDLEKQVVSENLEATRCQAEEKEARIQQCESERLRLEEELTNHKSNAEKQRQEMKAHIQRLEEDVSQQTSLSVSFEQEISRLRDASRTEKESSETIMKKLSDQKLHLEETIEKVKSDLASTRKDNAKAEESRAEKEAEAVSLQSALLSEKGELCKNLSDLTKVLEIEKDTLKKLEVMYDESQAELVVQRERANDLLSQKNDLEVKLEEMKSDLDSTKYSSQQAEEMMSATQERVAEGLREIEDLTHQVDEANKVLTYERETLKKLEELYDETLAALEVERTRADGLSNHNSDLSSEMRKHEEELSQKSSLIEELKSKFIVMQEQDAERNQLIEDLEKSKKLTKGLEMEMDKRDLMIEEGNDKLRETAKQLDDVRIANGNLNKEIEKVKGDLTLKETKIMEMNDSVAATDAMKREVVRVACGLRQRDMLLIAMVQAMSTLKSKASQDSIRRLNAFVANLSKKTGIALGKEMNEAGSLVRFKRSNWRRFGLGLGMTIPLVPLIAIAQTGQTDPSILMQPVLAMLGIMS